MCNLCTELDKDIKVDGIEISITKNNDKYELCVESEFDYTNGFNNYTYVKINYCPICGRDLK